VKLKFKTLRKKLRDIFRRNAENVTDEITARTEGCQHAPAEIEVHTITEKPVEFER